MDKTSMNKKVIDSIRELSKAIHHLQWYTSHSLQQLQDAKLKSVVAWHARHGEWFRNRLIAADCMPKDIARSNMSALPVTTRQDIISAGPKFFAKELPPGHGKPGQVKSSGSTGEPVVVQATDVVALFFHATNHMEVDWHRRDRKLRMAAVRAGQTPTGTHANWGMPHSAMSETGPCLIVNNKTDIKEQARLIYEFHTEILSCYPNVMDALMDSWQETGKIPALKHYKSLGETVSDAFRSRVERIMGVKVEDSYSSQELGTIANQCPQSGLYHTMDFNHIVEVLDQHDQQVLPGEIGRVVVTDLHNHASPLIRYDTGDWAEMGATCSCGRGLQTLRKVMGRTRNLIRRADGSRYWPMVGMYDFDKLDFLVRRYQVVQHSLTDIEYRIVVDEPVSESQQQDLINLAAAAMGSEFTYQVTQQTSDFAVNPNGKFEEFVCKI